MGESSSVGNSVPRLSIGTTSVFPYIATPVIDQARTGGVAVEINPGDSSVSKIVTHRIRAGAATALSAIWDRLEA